MLSKEFMLNMNPLLSISQFSRIKKRKHLDQCFSNEVILFFCPGHLAISGDMFNGHDYREGSPGI